MNHVLEHVQEPLDFLRDVKKLLVPCGFVHIAVPNIACWEARLVGWNCYEPYHLLYFNYATLVQAISAVGMELVQVSTYESVSGWFLALLRTILGVNSSGCTIERHQAAK